MSTTDRERVALAIHEARFAHPEHPRDDPWRWDRSEREYAFRLADAVLALLPAAPPVVPENSFAELRDWFEGAAINLQAATPDGNNPARYKGPHPCDCAHFADDAIARVRTLLIGDAK